MATHDADFPLAVRILPELDPLAVAELGEGGLAIDLDVGDRRPPVATLDHTGAGQGSIEVLLVAAQVRVEVSAHRLVASREGLGPRRADPLYLLLIRQVGDFVIKGSGLRRTRSLRGRVIVVVPAAAEHEQRGGDYKGEGNDSLNLRLSIPPILLSLFPGYGGHAKRVPPENVVPLFTTAEEAA
jgi:hypothetical protein